MPRSSLLTGPVDWVLLVWFLGVTVGVGFFYARRASRSLADYFLSARNLPWWALGTSMVATSFASDTPIVVSEMVLKSGIAGNWLWWNFAVGGTLTVFLFSRLWRRAAIVTEIELISKRYDGRAATALRGFKAAYLGLLLNSIVFGWVTKAMGQILEVMLGLEPGSPWKLWSIGILIGVTLSYSALSGLWGVVASDVLQFVVAMLGSIVLAVLAVERVGGLPELMQKAQNLETASGQPLLELFPTGWNAFSLAVLVLVLVNWWAVYYPGAEPGGGGYVAQRMFSASSEEEAQKGTLWYILAHYVLRPWPWVLTALAAAVLDPSFLLPAEAGSSRQPGQAYPWMLHVLPTGLRGILLASFISAYMSTITSLLNLSASYLVNDLYLVGARKGRGEGRGAVRVARWAVVLVTAFGSLVTWGLETTSAGWALVMNLTAGTGLVLILRWLWWRVSAWSEISAMAASALAYVATLAPMGATVEHGARTTLADTLAGGRPDLVEPLRLVFVVAISTAAWLGVTLLTRPVGEERLRAFFLEVRPFGWWGPVARATGVTTPGARRELILWAASTAMVYGGLFGVGYCFLLRPAPAAMSLAVAGLGAVSVVRGMRR